MISPTNLLDRTYVYSQSLDNSGRTDCWVLSENEEYKRIDTSKQNMSHLLDTIDQARSKGRRWSIGNKSIVFYVLLNGACVVRVKPLTLDVNGRLSYVQIVTNFRSKNRIAAADTLGKLAEITGRVTDGSEVKVAARCKKILKLPLWLIIVHIVLFSWRFSDD
ncbi:hypothetical protein D0907_11890 [Pseudoalteromonas lipolytica]|uniref:Uncharacterized protein n=1 Tax=Pseudoalteromonas lipolytica TaxID=570156 RepID=A0AAD0WD01_9GAMM|nr:hypothetical protein D0907_11890 [Pseudoalteromonas donghaensis]